MAYVMHVCLIFVILIADMHVLPASCRWYYLDGNHDNSCIKYCLDRRRPSRPRLLCAKCLSSPQPPLCHAGFRQDNRQAGGWGKAHYLVFSRESHPQSPVSSTVKPPGFHEALSSFKTIFVLTLPLPALSVLLDLYGRQKNLFLPGLHR